jgi:N-acetylglutamate synthase-like GNAT family acetyltransferase
VTIRDARLDDCEAIAPLLGHLGYPSSIDEVRRRLARLLESDVDRCVIAELDGELVGLATLHVSLTLVDDEPAAKLSAIVVSGSHRGRGVGRALLEAIETDARSRGCGSIFLTTAERRADAHEFYRRLGYAETGRRFAKTL